MNNPKIRVSRGNIGNEIWIQLPDLSSFEKTFLNADAATAATSMTVISGTNYSANTYAIIGTPGAEGTEIKLLSSAAATSLGVAALTNAHVQGTIVIFIPFNQIELYSASAVGGTYSQVSGSPVSIRVDSLETFIQQASDATTIAYKARFKNAKDTTYSDYSDEVVGSGYADNTVYAIKHRALDQLDEKIEGIITHLFLEESLWEARREVDALRKRWSWRMSFNQDIGDLVEGGWRIAVPTTLRDKNTNKNILSIKIGSSGRHINYLDKRDFDNWYEGIIHTTTSGSTSVGATTITLATARDLAASGSITVGSQVITYTSKTNSTGVLAGVPASGTGSVTATIATATDAWQNASFGEPTDYTLFGDDYIYFNVPFGSDFEGDNLIADFYKALTAYDSDSDVIDEPDYDAFVSYLKYKIKDKKKKGTVKKDTDPDYLDYVKRINAMISREILGQEIKFVPDIGHLLGEE